MKSIFLLLSVVAFGLNAVAQTTTWKEKIVGNWKYEGTEEFGVLTAADSTQTNDLVEFNADGSFRLVEKNRETKGTYKVAETAKTVTLTADKKSRLFYLKKSDPGVLILESQTPDLVRTRHRYTAVK